MSGHKSCVAQSTPFQYLPLKVLTYFHFFAALSQVFSNSHVVWKLFLKWHSALYKQHFPHPWVFPLCFQPPVRAALTISSCCSLPGCCWQGNSSPGWQSMDLGHEEEATLYLQETPRCCVYILKPGLLIHLQFQSPSWGTHSSVEQPCSCQVCVEHDDSQATVFFLILLPWFVVITVVSQMLSRISSLQKR